MCQLTNRSPASVSSRLARPLVRAFARRLASSVGASHAENRSARTLWPPGASTRTHSVARDLVRPLIERGGDQHQVEGSIGKGSRSATPPRRRAVHRPWTLQPHRSCPAPDRSPRDESARAAARHYPEQVAVPQPTFRILLGAGCVGTASAATRSASSRETARANLARSGQLASRRRRRLASPT